MSLQQDHSRVIQERETFYSRESLLPNPERWWPFRQRIYWSFFFLNTVVLWAFHTFVSAQTYYEKKFPDAKIQYWGFTAFGFTLLFSHILFVTFGVIRRVGYIPCVLSGFVGIVILGIVVIFVGQPYVIISAFAFIGLMNSATQSPMYAMAGMFQTPNFSQAMNAGNGFAGVFNINLFALIQFLSTKTTLENKDEVGFMIFVSILLCMAVASIFNFLYLCNTPGVKEVWGLDADQDYATVQDDAEADIPHIAEDGKEADTLINEAIPWKEVMLPAFTQFITLFVSLILFPGIASSMPKTTPFQKSWYSIFVIACFNYGDLIGRTGAGINWVASLPLKGCFVVSLLRLAFVPLVIAINKDTWCPSWVTFPVIFIVGLSNGIVATITMIKGPMMVRTTKAKEKVANVMTIALFAGLAFGPFTATSLTLLQGRG